MVLGVELTPAALAAVAGASTDPGGNIDRIVRLATFNAKPVVRAHAYTTASVPGLDAILFMLGVRGTDVDRDTEEQP